MISHGNTAPVLILIGACVLVGCQTTKSASSPSSAPPSSTGAVELVKGGVLTAYNSTTVGKAFGGTFQNAKWTSFETPKGVVIVEVNGTIKEKNRPNYFTTNLDTHILTDRYCKASLGLDAQTDYQSLPPDDERKRQLNRCINTLPDDADLPVKFQFTVSADRNSFQLSYGDIQSEKSGAVLDFIYN